ncbi:Tetratricopeptide repeat-containing protein [Aneurinibacillus thermoaerophilus]|uniref:Tetratricopeptide repeat-containing protein n=1 Tax=Aneurinibacillus thermoaerophilus TaxID=143495 RepID=A0A1G8CP10_ANETH|nr:tetratricopeptide repeat protein [Aneurinibacillus thermoaerophilus]SDH47281.1 Tetratricopeptide repeat-containing protein [Aneurinibacillus thermoaerophilus]
MNFQPEVGETIRLFGRKYTFSKHPAVEGIDIPYGQEGRQGTVYQLVDEQARTLHRYVAFKVFRERFKSERQIELAKKFQKYAGGYGLSACLRSVIEQQSHEKLVSQYEDLQYSVLMPWIEGPTWADILLEERALTREECLQIACTFAYIMKEMEEAGLAHCDLSSSNVLIPYLSKEKVDHSFADIELVDIEELYAPDVRKPPVLPGGSPGYAADYVRDGVWTANADRFAGAVLLAEMIAWHHDSIRIEKADDMSYFAAEEMQKKSERYRKIKVVVQDTLGEAAAELFTRAWESRNLKECPSFAEWFSVFPRSIKEVVINRKQAFFQAKKQPTSSLLSVESLLDIASTFEGLGNKVAAQREYRYIVSHFPEKKAVVEEIKLLLSEGKVNMEPQRWDLADYLEAANQMEKLEEWEKALLFYARGAQLPSIDFATKEELEIIVEELREKIRARQQVITTEAALQKILDEKQKKPEAPACVPNFSGKTKKQGPFLMERVWQFSVKRWKLLLSLSCAFLIGGLLIWLYNYTAEKKWRELIQKGTEAFTRQNYIEAEGFIRKAMDQKPTEDLYTKMATIYISRGYHEQAIRYLEDLFYEKKLSEKNQEAHYLIGRAYFLLNDFSNAIPYFEKARKGEKSIYEQDVIRDLVVSYARTNQYAKANNMVHQLKAGDLVSKAFIANLKGELFELQGKDSEAIEEFKNAVALHKGNERYIKNLVDLYIKKNKTNQVDDTTKARTYEEAISLMNELLKEDFTNIDYLNRLGQAYYDYGLYYEAKGNRRYINLFQQSLISYNQIIDLGIRNEEILLNIGILYDKLNQKVKAESIYKQVLKEYPNSGHAYFVYGLFKLKEKKYKEALTMLQKVVQLNQNPSEAAIAKERMKEMKAKKLI